jgi:hypothetical protein
MTFASKSEAILDVFAVVRSLRASRVPAATKLMINKAVAANSFFLLTRIVESAIAVISDATEATSPIWNVRAMRIPVINAAPR